jgi:hypothetical protein
VTHPGRDGAAGSEPEPSVVARRHDRRLRCAVAAVSPFTVWRSPSERGKGVVARSAIRAQRRPLQRVLPSGDGKRRDPPEARSKSAGARSPRLAKENTR